MRKTPIAAAITLSLALGAGPAWAAAPRITAQVTTRAGAMLTPAEQRAVSIAAGRLLRHTYNARTALKAKHKKQAAAEIAKAQKLVAIIERAEPTYTVKSQITAGDLSYEDEDAVKPTIIPIFDELDKVSLMAPLRQARAEKAKAAKAGSKLPPEDVAADELQAVQVALDLGLAKGGLELASRRLDKDDLAGAEKALAAVMGSLDFTVLDVKLPLDQARENLMLAKAAIEVGDKDEAKAALAAAGKELNAYAKGASEADKKEFAKLHEEIVALSDKLKGGQADKGFTATIEGWWDRVGKLMK